MNENQLGERILGCALKVHRALDPGLLETAYETCLAHELQKMGLAAQRQSAMPVAYDGIRVDLAYRLDRLVENKVIVEGRHRPFGQRTLSISSPRTSAHLRALCG